MSDVRCDLTELLVRDCAHCRGHREMPGGTGSFGRPFTAAHDGRCSSCDCGYYEGDRIRKDLERGGYAHDYCADEIEGSDA